MIEFRKAVHYSAFILTLLLMPLRLMAEETQWAVEVQSFSSQKGTKGYSANQALGTPNKCPATGDSPCAWAPANDFDKGADEEYLKVAFDHPMKVSQVAVAENFYPGSVSKVILFDTKGKEHVIYQGKPALAGINARVMHIRCMKTTYMVDAVKIVTQPGLVAGQNEIDAIAISDANAPVEAEINVAQGMTVGKRDNLGPGINSAADEVLPVISPDGKTLFVDRKNHPQNIGKGDNIWFSSQDANGNWGPLQNIGPGLNNGMGTFVSSVTPDGNTLLLGGTFRGPTESAQMPEHFGLWLSHRIPSGWSRPEEVKIKEFYTKSRFVEFTLSNDDRTIIMSVERNDSRGGKDLYVSFRDESGEWSVPKNLGWMVNSAGEEATPFIAADNKTLYFSSDGFPGYGGMDMFISRRLDDSWQKWSEPQNLGPQLNTPSWDAYYTVPASGEYAYFVSTENSYGFGDIMRVKLPEALRPNAVVLISGKVLDAKTGKPVNAKIKYEVLASGKEVGDASTNPTNGVYKISLPSGENYGYRAEAPGYVPVSENLNLTTTQRYGELERNLTLVPIEKGQTVRLNNIFFETAKWELQPESFAELDRVVKLLQTNPTMEIEIAGHTDNAGDAKSNVTLSLNRATAVKTYLQGKGIDPKRIALKGYGSTKPVADNATDEGRQLNRRVEFTIAKQ